MHPLRALVFLQGGVSTPPEMPLSTHPSPKNTPPLGRPGSKLKTQELDFVEQKKNPIKGQAIVLTPAKPGEQLANGL